MNLISQFYNIAQTLDPTNSDLKVHTYFHVLAHCKSSKISTGTSKN